MRKDYKFSVRESIALAHCSKACAKALSMKTWDRFASAVPVAHPTASPTLRLQHPSNSRCRAWPALRRRRRGGHRGVRCAPPLQAASSHSTPRCVRLRRYTAGLVNTLVATLTRLRYHASLYACEYCLPPLTPPPALAAVPSPARRNAPPPHLGQIAPRAPPRRTRRDAPRRRNICRADALAAHRAPHQNQ